MQNLIEQVRTLVQSTRPLCNPNISHADEDGDTTCRHCGIGMYCGEERNCPSQKSPYDGLLAHMQAQQAVVDAAREVSESRTRAHTDTVSVVDERHLRLKLDALDAALAALEKESNAKG